MVVLILGYALLFSATLCNEIEDLQLESVGILLPVKISLPNSNHKVFIP